MNKIDDYKQISTQKGDQGTSKNYSNEAFSKSDITFDTLGTIDELSSFLGLTFHHVPYQDEIQMIQKTLQHINSLIATNPNDIEKRKLSPITQDDIDDLETIEARVLKTCTIEPRFVLPGSESSQAGAYLDIARALARKAERMVNTFYEQKARNKSDKLLAYLNRLSDLLFILARSLD
ncbi:MAG: ATP:cob(I)alamin adenosyltransferase [Candidatus Izimaplasma sp.]|nr:ATP:cob(I)alamin adenosyltransferase [Candidatus Izimaplasma bacterium]